MWSRAICVLSVLFFSDSNRVIPVGELFMLRYKLATTLEERIAALRLVYNAYVNAGLIKPNEYGLRVTPFHLNPRTKIFLVVDNGETLHTMSFIPDSEMGLPMEVIYRREIDTLRRLGRNFGEVFCLAGTKISLDGFMGLCRFVFCYGLFAGLDHFVIAVHPRHARFYERIWGFRQFGPHRVYPCVENHPAVALELDFAQSHLRLPPRTKRFVQESPFTDADYSVPPPGDDELEYLSRFVDSKWQLVAVGPMGDQANSGELAAVPA